MSVASRRGWLAALPLVVALLSTRRANAAPCDQPVTAVKLPNFGVASTHMLRKEYAQARDVFRKVLDDHACAPGPLYGYASALEQLKEYELALEAYRDAARVRIEGGPYAQDWHGAKQNAARGFEELSRRLLQQTQVIVEIQPKDARVTRRQVTLTTPGLSVEKPVSEQLQPTFQVVVDADGYGSVSQSVTAKLGETRRIEVVLEEATCTSSEGRAYLPAALARVEAAKDPAEKRIERLTALGKEHACVPLLWLERGRAREEKGDYRKAVEDYERARNLKPPPAEGDLARYFGGAVEEAEKARAALQEKLDKTTLTVRATTSGGVIPVAEIGGVVIPIDTPTRVDPGKIDVEVSARGYGTIATSEQVKLGEQKTTQMLELSPDAPPPDTNAGWRTFGVVTAFTGGAVLAAGVTTFVLAAVASGEASDACSGGVCTDSSGNDTVERGRDLSTVTDYLVLSGAGLLVGGLGIRFILGSPPPAEAPSQETRRNGGARTAAHEKPLLLSISGRF